MIQSSRRCVQRALLLRSEFSRCAACCVFTGNFSEYNKKIFLHIMRRRPAIDTSWRERQCFNTQITLPPRSLIRVFDGHSMGSRLTNVS